MPQLTGLSSNEQHELIARQVAVTSALRNAFESLEVSAPLDLLDCLIPWRTRGKRDSCIDWPEIHEALAALDARLIELAPGEPARREAVRAWWRLQIERQVLAMRREAQWRLQGATPDLRSYLAVSARSIGVDWTAATLIALDPEAEVPGPHTLLWSAIDAIARAVRLAKDLHDPERELLHRGAIHQAAEGWARAELQELSTVQTARARELIEMTGGSAALRVGLEVLLRNGLDTYAPLLEMIPA